ncbi:DoxX family protein [Belliella kenyensis]|uniref:DoxX family protein n=1 Tax=Belliella kenyensis TaxID=1472724 RepID=A0ABV8EMT1_9BACT|nr:DoxX family protein [Belliella kenyensis]MCH7400458.1 DoxX family protein [Belliella kenyensis]MDN3604526.1 DoxX family protein [Belliella kenyensis]
MNKDIKVSGKSILLFRILLSGIFINAGISHLLKPESVAERIQMAAMNSFATFFGDPYYLGLLSGYVLLIGGFALALGICVRGASIGLFLTLIPITITIQLGNGIMHGPLWKNVALFGGLLFFIINNPDVYRLFNLQKSKS